MPPKKNERVARQRKIVVKACGSSQRDRFAPWIDVFGIGADEEDQIDGIDDFVGKLYAWIVRNAGEGNGVEAWRRLHSEYDPHVVRTHCDASELRIQDLRWGTGSLRNVNTRCSLTVTDDPARHHMTALWRDVQVDAKEPGRGCHVPSRSCLTRCWPTAARSSRSW